MAVKEIEGRPYALAERRIARLTLIVGFSAAVLTGVILPWRSAAGVAIGTTLGWVNFRWLGLGLDALMRLSITQAWAPRPRVPLWTWIRLLGRYGLIGLTVYAIFVYFKVPILSMLAGLCALGAATMAASVYEVFCPAE